VNSLLPQRVLSSDDAEVARVPRLPNRLRQGGAFPSRDAQDSRELRFEYQEALVASWPLFAICNGRDQTFTGAETSNGPLFPPAAISVTHHTLNLGMRRTLSRSTCLANEDHVEPGRMLGTVSEGM
jgi:hypothetical protein